MALTESGGVEAGPQVSMNKGRIQTGGDGVATSDGKPGEGGGAAPQAEAAPAAMPMAKKGMMFTMNAAQGFDSAQLVNSAMANKHVGKTNPRRVLVAEPDGPSTSGGKKARQTITLAPVSGVGGTVMCGWLDVAKKAAGLRDYRSVGDQYQGRYGAALDITPEEYLGIVRDLEALMKTLGVVATHEQNEPVKQAAKVAQQITAPEPEESAIQKPLAIALAAVVVVAGVVAIVMLMR